MRVAWLAVIIAGHVAWGYEAPKTSFGDPDLQGLWTNSSLTQLERRPNFDHLVLTPQEAQHYETKRRERNTERSVFHGPTLGEDDGTPIREMHGYNAFWRDSGDHVGVVNGELRSSWIVEPANGMIPYQPEAKRHLDQKIYDRYHRYDNPEDIWPCDRCIVGFGSTSGPPMLNVLYNNFYQIAQSPGFVTIVVEMNHDARVIRLGGKHIPENIRPWMGDSIGHWEGDTLVVETTNLNPGQEIASSPGQNVYIPSSAKIVERFTRVAANAILYRFEVTDPHAYTQTWKAEMPMLAVKGPMYEFACHEGDHSLEGILAGARYAEKTKKPAHSTKSHDKDEAPNE